MRKNENKNKNKTKNNASTQDKPRNKKLEDLEKVKSNAIKSALKKKNTKKNIVAIALVFAMVSYGVFVVGRLIKNPTDTFIVSNGDLSKEEIVDGYIVRDESTIEGTDYKNGIIKIKEEGQRVANGDVVFRYYSNKENEIKEKINELDNKIQEVLSNEDTPFSTDKKLLESQIESELNNIYGENEIQKIQEYKKSINTYITKKAKIIGDKSPAGSYLKNLIEERTACENQLVEEAEYISTTTSGMVSYKVDGLEDVLTTENLQNINNEFLESLNLKVGQIVANSDKKAKIVDNYSCYIIFNTNSEEAKKASVDDKIKVQIQDNTQITATVVSIIEENNNTKTIAIKIEKNIEQLLSYRKISFEIVWWRASGFRIPNSAIKKIDGINYVVRNRNGYFNKMAVKILKQNEDYSVVEAYTRSELLELGLSSNEISNLKTITLYDEILLEPTEKQLSE